MKKLTILLLITFVLTGCKTSQTELNSLKTIQDKGKMIVGFTNYPPLGFQNETGETVGLDIEIAKEVAKRLGVSVEFQYIDWDNKTFELNNKNIDMIWNGFTVTEEREKEVNFSKPYMDNQIVIVSRVDTPIKTIDDLNDVDVAVETQSSGQLAIEKSSIFDSINSLQKYTSISDALLALNAKTVDAIIADITYAGYLQSQNNNAYIISDESFDSEYYAIGFRKQDDNALRDAIDAIIDDLIEDGTASEISIKWLSKDLIRRP